MEKGSKYIRYSRIATKYSPIPLIGLFIWMAMIGAIDTTGYSYTENCAGTPSDPCLLFWNVTMHKTVYIQADENWMQTSPPVKEIIFKRSWGSSWRTIDLTKPWSSTVKYALKLERGKSYQFMFVAYKSDPRDVINWSINPVGVWGEAKANINCDKKTITWDESIIHYKEVEHYNEKNKTYWNETVFDYKKIVEHSREECIPNTKRIEYGEYRLEYGKEAMGCSIMDTSIVCDLQYTGDANGDGICQDGETCSIYDLTDKIQFKETKNGDSHTNIHIKELVGQK